MKSHRYFHRHSSKLFPALLLSVLLGACHEDPDHARTYSEPTSVTVATGAAVAEATVRVRCVAGTVSSALTTEYGRAFVYLDTATMPCLVQASFTEGGVQVKMHSILNVAKDFNITPLTESIAAEALRTTDVAKVFDATDSAKLNGGAANTDAAIERVRTVLKDKGVDITTVGSPIYGILMPEVGKRKGDEHDAVLEAIKVKFPGQSSVADLVAAVRGGSAEGAPGSGTGAGTGTGNGNGNGNGASAMTEKILTADLAIAQWPTNVPAGEKRPVVVLMPGWGGQAGLVNASNARGAGQDDLAKAGYVTLAIGFNGQAGWATDLPEQVKAGLDKLCADNTIPANCNAIALTGNSYGGMQSRKVADYLRGQAYDGAAGSKGKVLAILATDAGHTVEESGIEKVDVIPFPSVNLVDTNLFSVAMIQNAGDKTFEIDSCAYSNCGVLKLAKTYRDAGKANVLSDCSTPAPADGADGHGIHTGGAVDWNVWTIDAIKIMLHNQRGIAKFTSYTEPTKLLTNACGI